MLMSTLRDWLGEHPGEVLKEVRRHLTPKSESQKIYNCHKHTEHTQHSLDFKCMFSFIDVKNPLIEILNI